MNRDQDTIYAEALRWHEASHDDAMDWDGFTAWLEADARHRDAYDAVALGEALIAEHGASLGSAPAAANDDFSSGPAPSRRNGRWMRWASMAIAASLLAILVAPSLLSPPQSYHTTGASRTIALADGSSVILAPHSELTVDGRHQERMALNGGAWFDIRHDPSRSLEITAGGVQIGDIGTRFDVQETAGQVRVEVAEGVVSIRSAALDQPIRLTEGRGLAYDARSGTALVQPIRMDSIGEWRSGRLSFEDASLALVAADLSRYAGTRVTVAPGIRDRRFSGTLVVGDGKAALRDLTQLMGIELRPGPGGVVLDAPR